MLQRRLHAATMVLIVCSENCTRAGRHCQFDGDRFRKFSQLVRSLGFLSRYSARASRN